MIEQSGFHQDTAMQAMGRWNLQTYLSYWLKHMHTFGSCSSQGIRAALVLARVTLVSCQLPGRVIHTGKGQIKSQANPHTQLLATDHQPLLFTCYSSLKLLCAEAYLGHLSRHNIHTLEAVISFSLNWSATWSPPTNPHGGRMLHIFSQRSWTDNVELGSPCPTHL